jgi:hypothetical protein
MPEVVEGIGNAPAAGLFEIKPRAGGPDVPRDSATLQLAGGRPDRFTRKS